MSFKFSAMKLTSVVFWCVFNRLLSNINFDKNYKTLISYYNFMSSWGNSQFLYWILILKCTAVLFQHIYIVSKLLSQSTRNLLKSGRFLDSMLCKQTPWFLLKEFFAFNISSPMEIVDFPKLQRIFFKDLSKPPF